MGRDTGTDTGTRDGGVCAQPQPQFMSTQGAASLVIIWPPLHMQPTSDDARAHSR